MRLVYRWHSGYEQQDNYEPAVNHHHTIRIEQLCEDIEIILYSLFLLSLKRDRMLPMKQHVSPIVFTVCPSIFCCVFLFAYFVSPGFSHPLCFSPKRDSSDTRCAALLQWFKGKKYQNILFTAEKIFVYPAKIEFRMTELLRSQGEDAAEVTRMQHSSSVMGWWGVSYRSTTQIHFCEEGVKTDKNVYWRMLEDMSTPSGYSHRRVWLSLLNTPCS